MKNVILNNGVEIPILGFGTLNIPRDRMPTKENTAKTAEIVGMAIEVGYRHIDTAQSYGNEKGVGDAIKASGIPREEFFITSKLGNGNHRPDDVLRSFEETLQKLGLEYLDLFLIHWPLPTLYDGDFVSTWKAMTELVNDGRVRSVGVSNFQPAHLERIIKETGIVPSINQIAVHPTFNNDTARESSIRHSIAIEAHSPLGHGKILDDPIIGQIAATHGKTSAQIILRWHIQHDHIVIPKSMHRERMEENLNIFDFELTSKEVALIDGLDKGEEGRLGPNPDTFDWIPTGEGARPFS